MQIHVTRELVLSGHSGPLYCMVPMHEPIGILASGSDGVISFWPAGTSEGAAIATCGQPVFSMSWLVHNHILLAGTQHGILYWIDIPGRTVIKSLKFTDKPLFDILIHDTDILISDGGGCMHRLQPDGKCMRYSFGTTSIRTLIRTNDRVLAGNSEGKVLSWHPEMGFQEEFQAHRLSVFRLLAWNEHLLTSGRDAHINQFVMPSFSPEKSVPGHLFAVNDLVISPDLRLLFSGSMDKTIKIWEPESLELKKVLDNERNGMHKHGINRLLWAHDRLYSCGDDRNIMVWHMRTLP